MLLQSAVFAVLPFIVLSDTVGYYTPEKEPELPPQPYAYEFGVRDDYTGSTYQKSEVKNEYGAVEGSYQVELPDGRLQIVTYRADKDGGYTADVSYQGEAQFPPEPEGGYGKYEGPGAWPGPKPGGYQ